VTHIVRDGRDTDFLRGNWLPKGGSVATTKPLLFSYVDGTRLTVEQGLINHRWVRDISDALSNRAVVENFSLRDELQGMQTQ
jgi:hypothetical protein